ncbi:hypothetical protein J2858_003789 [Neorhizobium galegae]|uniref:hypothetical protein n=1 Tax=Neorhizobium galegae TaxID=399 RepID=UPI001AE27C67|nr:hypothetical protein [Neorhizobium galegae]MBP2550849.1 hypothetical protein [Neorhizobium galegae]
MTPFSTCCINSISFSHKFCIQTKQGKVQKHRKAAHGHAASRPASAQITLGEKRDSPRQSPVQKLGSHRWTPYGASFFSTRSERLSVAAGFPCSGRGRFAELKNRDIFKIVSLNVVTCCTQ